MILFVMGIPAYAVCDTEEIRCELEPVVVVPGGTVYMQGLITNDGSDYCYANIVSVFAAGGTPTVTVGDVVQADLTTPATSRNVDPFGVSTSFSSS